MSRSINIWMGTALVTNPLKLVEDKSDALFIHSFHTKTPCTLEQGGVLQL